MKTKAIPFLDLVTPHAELRDELLKVVGSALDTAAFIGGPGVEAFERNFAEFCETEHCVGVGSGTDALRFALMAAGVAAGDAVVTVPNTFIATTEAISQAGARPVFVDVDEQTYNMCPERLEEYLRERCFRDSETGHLTDRELGMRVKAVVPVHLYGQMADMDRIQELADRYDLTVVEDACQAHGAEYFSRKAHAWKKAGSMGCAAAFSFYPGKNLGACGEAGAVTTNDAAIARKIRMIRDHGQAQKYYHSVEGYNGRLDAIQAGMLDVKLRRLPEWNERRRRAARRYHSLLAESGTVAPPYEPNWSRAVYHLYVIRVQQREAFMKHLAADNIGTGIHYPVPLHLQAAYQDLGYTNGDFPVAEKAAEEIVSLPMFPGLGAAEQRRIVDQMATFAPQTQLAAAAAHA